MRIRRARPYRLLLWCLMALVLPASGAGGDAGQRLRAAASLGDARAVHEALQAGAPIDARDARGRTALLLATHGNHVDAARVLVQAGADVNAKDAIQDSPYLYAGARGLDAILELTLQHGADLASTNRYGGTALIPAAERGHVRTVQRLLQAGVAVDHVNRLHWTALLEAIVLSDGGPAHVEIVQALLAAGADPMLADGEGVTPLAHARQRGYHAIVSLLRAAGADH
ncbi:ankyrin repeat domain-containing protein [Stenotrophomonas sp. 24(2023)]|uniref:ankyrin repeat domain-containing protein n=1 Tax=Stenotrophomonas sp. 24(2023) TaxID=3068324 RepID=UPI0027E0C8D2|nr:ankyrin repeat domain-containing protein [Stenotrophomonas sp. 24(2023)]WMJ69505.1 ankyrin repeat domain-containing protein [Stenotrophomonas sp. 24(2023)]